MPGRLPARPYGLREEVPIGPFPSTAAARRAFSRRCRTVARAGLFRLLGPASAVTLAISAPAESVQVFGLHFWDWGADLDVMSRRTGWVVEASASEGYPNVGGRYAPAIAEGFTIVQRLDWSFDCSLGTIPRNPSDYPAFAGQCAGNWALPLRNYCRHFVIGNEMEICGPIGAAEYAACFEQVRDAIRAVHPEAQVIIGAFTSIHNLRTVIGALGPDGYDGVAAHFNGVPRGMCELLDEMNARDGVGVYITEFGWVIGTNPNAMQDMRRIYDDIAAWNANPNNRTIYCSCWYFYPEWLGAAAVFSLERSVAENEAFEACTALGTAANAFVADVTRMSAPYVEMSFTSGDVTAHWTTDRPTRDTLWYLPPRAHNGEFVHLSANESTQHSVRVSDPFHWWPRKEYTVIFRSIAWGSGNASAGPLRVTSGPWSVDVVDVTGERARVRWQTLFTATGRVEYGRTQRFGDVRSGAAGATSHDILLNGLEPETTYYLRAWAEADGFAPHVSPTLTFQTGPPSPRLGSWEISSSPRAPSDNSREPGALDHSTPRGS